MSTTCFNAGSSDSERLQRVGRFPALDDDGHYRRPGDRTRPFAAGRRSLRVSDCKEELTVMGESEDLTESTCRRVGLSHRTKRRLWSESGGYCANPQCSSWLFDGESEVDFGELAHIIAASRGGPRDVEVGAMPAAERADHSNVVVLCANCHTRVDKAPDVYPAAVLVDWKRRQQEAGQRAFGTPKFTSREAARQYLEPLIAKNRAVFLRYGPVAGDFSEDRAALWRRHAASSIVPTNAAIERLLQQNFDLLSPEERAVASQFALHAREFADRHVFGGATVGSATYPEAMDKMLTSEAQ